MLFRSHIQMRGTGVSVTRSGDNIILNMPNNVTFDSSSATLKPIEEMSVSDFESVLDVHVVGAFALTKALVPHMKQRGKGCVLFTASMTSFLGQPLVTGYSAAKSAYLGMIRGMTTELAVHGIRVNGIAPGWIDTPMLRKAIEGDDERRNKILGRTPMKKFGKPEDIGWAAVYLASDAAAFVSGQVPASPYYQGGARLGFRHRRQWWWAGRCCCRIMDDFLVMEL